MEPITVTDVLQARRGLVGLLPPTPMWSYPTLDAVAGTTVHIKHENTQPTGAFKVRGGLTLITGMSTTDRAAGVVTYSTGNHAQSIAYAARRHGVPSMIVMPEQTSEIKVRSVAALGGTVELHGATLEDAHERAEQLAADRGGVLVDPGEEPALIAGVATLYLEVIEAVPDLDVIVVPIGSGTGAAAACVVTAAIAPRCRVIGVQSAEAPAAHDSWRSGSMVQRPNRTAVEGVATGRPYALPQSLLRGRLADFVLVTDAEIAAAQRVLAVEAHTLAEGAGAAALAAVLAAPDQFAGQRVALICTGGNASTAELARLAHPTP